MTSLEGKTLLIFLCLFASLSVIAKGNKHFLPLQICGRGVCKDSDPPKFINIGYVGGSYDIFRGNPLAIGRLDPGFLFGQNIFDFTYNSHKTTTDGAYLIPDGTSVNSVESCSFSFSSSTTKSTKSYSDSLKVHADANFKYFGASFSASADYQEVHQSTSSGENVYVSSQAECETYGASIDGAPLASAFADDVLNLPIDDDSNIEPYISLIRTWGTHVASSIMMGGRYGMRSQFTTSKYTSMASTKLNIKAAAGYSGLFSISASLTTDVQKEQAEQFEDSRKDVQMFQLGGKPPVDENGTAFQWAQTVKAVPMPLSYSLTELTSYINKYYFPEQDITQMTEMLKKAMVEYCKQSVPRPDLCETEYGPEEKELTKVYSDSKLYHRFFNPKSGRYKQYWQVSENPSHTAFGTIMGDFEDNYPANSPYVIPNLLDSPHAARSFGFLNSSANTEVARYKCPDGYSTVTDTTLVIFEFYLPGYIPFCIENDCFTQCSKGAKCDNPDSKGSCYYIGSGYPELGYSGNSGFFRDLSIEDSTPNDQLFKCLTYKCLEIM